MTQLHSIVLRITQEGCRQAAAADIRQRAARYLEQPRNHSRLLKRMIDPKSARAQQRREVRAVGPHALCVGHHGGAEEQLPWPVVRLAPVEGD